jgi:hypothetical protein
MWQKSKIFPRDFFEYPAPRELRTEKIRLIKVYMVRFDEKPVYGFPIEERSEKEKGIAFSYTDPRTAEKSFIHSELNRAVKSAPEFIREYEFWTSASNRRPEIPQHILNDVP